MRIYRNLSTISVIVFLIGIIITGLYLINLPDQLIMAIPSLSGKADKLTQVMYNMYLIVGIELTVGIFSILFLFLSNQKKQKMDVVYVDKYSNAKDKEETEAIENKEIVIDRGEIDTKLQNVSSILLNENISKKEMEKALSFICNQVEACQGAIFLKIEKDGKRMVKLHSSYAYSLAESAELIYEYGEGLTGQAAKEGKLIKIDSVPDGYIKIFSGLGHSSPSNLMFIPIQSEGETLGIIEVASFRKFVKWEEEFLKELTPIFGNYIHSKQLVETNN